MIRLLKKNVKCQVYLNGNGLDLSNNVCEYEVNPLTNENVIRGNETLT